MGSIGTMTQKPHAVCVPWPSQGHINPMLQLAKLLHYRGFHITYVHSEYNHRRLIKSRGPNALDGLPTFRFETIPDGLPPVDGDATQDVALLCDSTARTCLGPFRDLLSKLNSSPELPPVTCVVADGVMTFAVEAANELGLPSLFFQTTSACGFMGYAQYHRLIEKGYVPLKDESYITNGYLDTVIDWIPGMKDIRLKDIPMFIRTTDRNDIMLNYMVNESARGRKASAVILNTFDALEHEVLDGLSTFLPTVYSIGPLQLQLEQIPADNELKAIEGNLWKEDVECFKWLDSKEPNSVVYINFGSIAFTTPEEFVEFAWGLANSKKTFFWVLRPDLVKGQSAVIPEDFLEETKDRRRLASWCNQEKVLNHPAIGVFLTHSGWNSNLESLTAGVPMLNWSYCGEQPTNARVCSTTWGAGLQVNEGEVTRDYVEGLVRKLMDEDEGKKIRNKALEWKRLAREAVTGPNGSSFVALENAIKVLLSLKKSE